MLRRPFLLFSILVHLVVFYLLLQFGEFWQGKGPGARVFNVVPVGAPPTQPMVPAKREKLMAPAAPAASGLSASSPLKTPAPPPAVPPQGEVPVIVKPFELISPPKGPGPESDDRYPGGSKHDTDELPPQPPPSGPAPADPVQAAPVIPGEPLKKAPLPEKQKADFLDTVKKIETQQERFTAPRDPSRLPLPDKKTSESRSQQVPPDLRVGSAAVGNALKDFDRRKAGMTNNASGVEHTPFGEVDEGLGGDGKSARGGSAFFNIKGYDITPWAQRVVYRIKRNWNVPAAVQAGIQGKVGFYVVIEKDGSISHAEFREYSKIIAYNEAVSAAFRSSAPLPPLPPDFPNKNLEAYFIFRYN